MRIAICDDDIRDLNHLNSLLVKYSEKANVDMEISSFDKSNNVLFEIQSGTSFDLIFFDVMMPGLSGIEAAKILRKTNTNTQLIFVTNSKDFAIDAFAVKAKDYLLKPINENTLFMLLDELGIEQKEQQSFVINSKSGLRKIFNHQLVYCEVLGHTVYWHLSSGAIVESFGTMKKTSQYLVDCDNFYLIHRSFLVNFDYITGMRRSDLTAELKNMIRLPVARSKFSDVLEIYKNREKNVK